MKRTEMEAYALRLPREVKRQLEAAAIRNDRSLNSEIVQRLKQSLVGYRQ
jgi:predicted HicB family RNase H-like nuclease